MSIVLSGPNRLSTVETTALLQRICRHMHIAYSANHVHPGLADISYDANTTDNERLNAVGKRFGLRFREMSGSFSDLLQLVSGSGPAMLRSENTNGHSFILVLQLERRGRVLINIDGLDRVVPQRELRRLLTADESGYHWQLIQQMFASGDASRLHYENQDPGEPLTPLKRFIALLKPEAQDIRTILIFSIVIGLLSLTTPLAVEAVVNTIAFGRYIQPLVVLSLIVFVFLAFRAGLNVLMTVVTEIIQRKLFVRTVEDLAYRLTRVPLSTWKHYHGPELVNRFFDIVNIQKITSKLLLDTLMLGLQTIIGLTVLAFYHPFLLGYDIGLLAMMTIILYFMGRNAVTTAKDESQLKYETAAWLQEIVRHPAAFKFNGGLGFAINRADELAAQYINHRQRHFRILIRQISFAMTMQVIAATVLLALGGYLVITAQMTLGQLVAAELIVTVILGSFAKLGKDLESFYDLMASVDKLGKLFDLPTEPSDKLNLARRPGAYDLSLVDLRLANGPSSPTNVEFESSGAYAIYGGTETLRTHLLETMIGQTKPQGGHITLDGFRVDEIGAESLQAKISLIADIELFESTVDENLRMGRENIGSAEINEVVANLGFRQTLAALPKGFNSAIRICGHPLSQGEAIRLVLARALVAKPAVLFIDNLLDRLSDDDLEDVLSRLSFFQNDTTIIIGTGRKSIARWSTQCLDLRQPNWNLASFND